MVKCEICLSQNRGKLEDATDAVFFPGRDVKLLLCKEHKEALDRVNKK